MPELFVFGRNIKHGQYKVVNISTQYTASLQRCC